jgi:endogenous inhibitor of DNA gyrase (YacG/DUF329 family)
VNDESAPVPINVGQSGLMGRSPVSHFKQDRPIEEDPEGEAVAKRHAVGAMPGNCRRVRSSPLPIESGGGCLALCDGRQRNGDCLLDVVRAAEAAGIKGWCFEVDPNDGYWDYAGPPIPGYVQERGEAPGAVIGRWEPGSEPAPIFDVTPIAPPSYDCPHCGEHVVQDPSNLHYWCPRCGKNATDPQEAA